MFTGIQIPDWRELTFNDSNEQVFEAIVNDDVESLADVVLSESDGANQLFGIKNKLLPIFISSAPPILCVCAYYNAQECFNFLIDNAADITKKDLLKRNVVQFAIASRSMDMVRLTDQLSGIDFNEPDHYGNKPIHVACQFGFLDCVKYLFMKYGLEEFNVRNNKGALPLFLAAYFGHFEVVKFIREIGVSLIETDNSGFNSLHLAAIGGNSDIVKYLVDEGLGVDIKTFSGETPLILACRSGSLDAVKVLVENGAVFKRKNAKLSPIIEAASYGHLDIIDYLVKKGADIKIQNSANKDILTTGLESGHYNVVKYALSNGVQPNLKDSFAKNIFRNALLRLNFKDIRFVVENFGTNFKIESNVLFFRLTSSHKKERVNARRIVSYLIDKDIKFSKTFIQNLKKILKSQAETDQEFVNKFNEYINRSGIETKRKPTPKKRGKK